MSGPRIGELFAGYGGLGQGVQAVLGGEIAWFSEFDKAPSKILAHHWPDVPNHGDITLIDWSTVEPVDILTGGFPCQDVSLAGARAGFTATSRSGLWSEFARAIDALKPERVLIENVRGLLSAPVASAVEPDPWGVGDGAVRPINNAFGIVLGDLANLGYCAQWCGVRAADAGAPHGRYRVFIHAYPANLRHERGRPTRDRGAGSADGGEFAADSDSAGLAIGGTPGVTPGASRKARTAALGDSAPADWGDYEPAIRRWEAVTGRPAPAPTNGDGKNGSHRLSARFVEWMMGLNDGHVTDVGLTRNEQLKALGNGVVPQQAEMALRVLLSRMTLPTMKGAA